MTYAEFMLERGMINKDVKQPKNKDVKQPQVNPAPEKPKDDSVPHVQ